jgi:hypothetical protein
VQRLLAPAPGRPRLDVPRVRASTRDHQARRGRVGRRRQRLGVPPAPQLLHRPLLVRVGDRGPSLRGAGDQGVRRVPRLARELRAGPRPLHVARAPASGRKRQGPVSLAPSRATSAPARCYTVPRDAPAPLGGHGGSRGGVPNGPTQMSHCPVRTPESRQRGDCPARDWSPPAARKRLGTSRRRPELPVASRAGRPQRVCAARVA